MIFIVILYQASFTHWIVIEKLLVGSACIFGAIFLWRGSIWGYRISILSWILILWISASSIYVAVSPKTIEDLRIVMLSKDIIFSVIGLTILSILIGDMLRMRRV